MSFESLAFRHCIKIENFPPRWLTLIYLYDPDLPLFPLYYFHEIPSSIISTNRRPSDSERIFGYIEKINLLENNSLDVHIVVNKNLNRPENTEYLSSVTRAIRDRLGLSNPVILTDIENTFINDHQESNRVLIELWHRVVSNSFGDTLPFGSLYDPVFGLIRFVASFYSPGGRKSEYIQTHYFLSKIGQRIQSSGDIPQVDFYLLPTYYELRDRTNPINSFPDFRDLVAGVNSFCQKNCTTVSLNNRISISKFALADANKLTGEYIRERINSLNSSYRNPMMEAFNSFDKGPNRTVIFYMMLGDIRSHRYDPSTINVEDLGDIYDYKESTYQSPKVISIYCQQCFGNENAIPIDTWIETFLKYPLSVFPQKPLTKKDLLNNVRKIGKTERLLWIAGQARKVHSSACNDAIWCTKYTSKTSNKSMTRGPNPLACTLCLTSIRDACPAYNNIKEEEVSFNNPESNTNFKIVTSAGNNVSLNQKFISCDSKVVYESKRVIDDFSPIDVPDGFNPFPQNQMDEDTTMTVEEFVHLYEN